MPKFDFWLIIEQFQTHFINGILGIRDTVSSRAQPGFLQADLWNGFNVLMKEIYVSVSYCCIPSIPNNSGLQQQPFIISHESIGRLGWAQLISAGPAHVSVTWVGWWLAGPEWPGL